MRLVLFLFWPFSFFEFEFKNILKRGGGGVGKKTFLEEEFFKRKGMKKRMTKKTVFYFCFRTFFNGSKSQVITRVKTKIQKHANLIQTQT